MSRKHERMDTPFQIWNIHRFLKVVGIEVDTIDVYSLMDSSLRYPENEQTMRELLKIPWANNYEQKYKYQNISARVYHGDERERLFLRRNRKGIERSEEV
jgi:hypothetical protein